MRILFWLLFKYSLSSFFRIFSFSLFLLDMLTCDNVQYFSFLSFSSYFFVHFENPAYKLDSIFCIIYSFYLIIYSFCFPYFCRLAYKKLSRYFIDNLFRIKGCYLVMTLVYGVRPLLRGFAHTFYDHHLFQLFMLFSIDVILIVALLGI